MKKKEKKEKKIEVNIYDIIDNTAYIKPFKRTSTLINIKTKEFILPLKKYTVYPDEDRHLYTMTYKDHKKKKTYASIYDTKDEKFVVYNWEVYGENIDTSNKIIDLISPIDNKIHVFNNYIHKTKGDIFNISLDEAPQGIKLANFLYDAPGVYNIITIDGSKYLYYLDNENQKSVISNQAYDDITSKRYQGTIIYTKNNKKAFSNLFGQDFNNLEKKNYIPTIHGLDKKGNLIYDDFIFLHSGKALIGIRDNMMDVYIHNKKVLTEPYNEARIYGDLSQDSENIKMQEPTFLRTMKNNKKGLVKITIDKDNKVDKEVVLEEKYDSIEIRDETVWAVSKNNKYGLLIHVDDKDYFISPEENNYNKIDYNQETKTAFLYNEDNLCDILDVNENKFVVTGCLYCDKQYSNLYVVQVNDKENVLTTENKLISKEWYDKIDNWVMDVDFGIFILEKDGLYQLAKYKDKTFVFDDENAKRYKKVDFYADIMALESASEDKTYIYSYDTPSKEGELLLTEPGHVNILETKTYSNNLFVKNENNYGFEYTFNEKANVYIINDTAYLYNKEKNNLKRVGNMDELLDIATLYMKTLEGKDAKYQLISANPNDFDKLDNEKDTTSYLDEMSKRDHPTVLVKKTKKRK